MFVAEFTRDSGRSYVPFNSVRELIEYLHEADGRLSRLWNQ
jgi:hypothetical protein